jgi:integrase
LTKKSATRARTALTHRYLETMKAEAAAYRIPDARCAGLAIRVAPSGVVSFDLAYRVAKSKTFRRLSLGKFPDVSLEGARGRANELTRAARAGRDLIAEEAAIKRTAEARFAVGDLITDYAARRLHGRLRTASEIEARLRRALRPDIDRPADELRRADLRRLLDACADAGYLREAEQRRIGLNGFFQWALSQDHIEVNPMAGLTSYGRSPPRKRVLEVQEIEALWRWLATDDMPPEPADVLRLQLCLGARCSEVGGMRVEEFDTKTWLWTLPAERSKNKRERVTPIVGIAREILSRRIGKTLGGHLFLTDTGRWLASMHVGHFLLNHVPPIAKFGTHDLRRTVATEMAEALSISLDAIARVIGHMAGSASTRTLVSHYVSAHFIAEKTNALLAWDNRLRSIIDGNAGPASNVVPLVGTRRA